MAFIQSKGYVQPGQTFESMQDYQDAMALDAEVRQAQARDESAGIARGIAQSFKEEHFDPKYMALDMVDSMFGGPGGLVSMISKGEAHAHLINSFFAAKQAGANTQMKFLDMAANSVNKAPDELLKDINDIRFATPGEIPKDVRGRYQGGMRHVILNPENMAIETPFHEMTHHAHRARPEGTRGARTKTEKLINYATNKAQKAVTANRETYEAMKKEGIWGAKKYYKKARKYYNVAPGEVLAKRVADRATKFKGTMTMDDWLKMYDEELDIVYETMEKTAPKMTKAAKEAAALTDAHMGIGL